jgi:hypothetical protein
MAGIRPMTPLTLQILAAMLQAHGPDATVASDHQGIEFLLTSLRQDLQEHASQQKSLGKQIALYWKAVYGPGFGKLYGKVEKPYSKTYDKMQPAAIGKPSPPSPGGHGGGGRRGK